MPQQELLRRVVQVLGDAGIDYMVTGSFASSLQGEPRVTHDVDLVVAIPAVAVHRLAEAFPPPRYYLDEYSIQQAISQQGQFNLIDNDEGDKVDFWMLTDEPFDQSRFSRKQLNEIVGIQAYVSCPEDTILMKLRWADMLGGSEKQFRDALRV